MEGWLKASGAVGLDGLELADFPDTGRGVKTLRSFKEGEKILTIPSALLWTVKHANADPLLGPALREAQPPLSIEDTLASYILFVRSRESGYDGPRSHIAKFPTSYSSSIFFTNDELEVCAGTSLYILTKQLQKWVENDYKALVTRLFGRHRNLFPAEKTTIEAYKWALCTVWSRAMDFQLPDGTSVRALAPFADMFNHSSKAKQCHLYDTSTGNISVLAGKNYEAGDQVFIYYGPSPNSCLLRLYGFVVPDNPCENYELVLETQAIAPGFQQKKRLWVAAGLDSECTIPLTLTNPLPKGVLQYLRIQRLNDSQLAFVTPQRIQVVDEKISDLNEVQALQFLVESFDAILDQFGTPLEKLEKQLAQGVYSPGGNAWGAAHVSIGEQRVLRLARLKAQELLATVRASLATPMRCVSCKQSSPTLMACGRCKSVQYCGRECQVAHFKEHKAVCLAMAAAKG